jgi:hypothetical protein
MESENQTLTIIADANNADPDAGDAVEAVRNFRYNQRFSRRSVEFNALNSPDSDDDFDDNGNLVARSKNKWKVSSKPVNYRAKTPEQSVDHMQVFEGPVQTFKSLPIHVKSLYEKPKKPPRPQFDENADPNALQLDSSMISAESYEHIHTQTSKDEDSTTGGVDDLELDLGFDVDLSDDDHLKSGADIETGLCEPRESATSREESKEDPEVGHEVNRVTVKQEKSGKISKEGNAGKPRNRYQRSMRKPRSKFYQLLDALDLRGKTFLGKYRGSNKDGSLAEKLELLESGQLNEVKLVADRLEWFNQLIADQEEYERKKKLISSFKYATDTAYLRSTVPEDMFSMIRRREAWRQGMHVMIVISAVQLLICFTVILTWNEPINASTVFMACLYVLALACTNSFEVVQDLGRMIYKSYVEYIYKSSYFGLWCILLVCLSPIWIALGAALLVCAVAVDLACGKMRNISYAEAVNMIVSFVAMFTGFSCGLRSGSAVNAVQTFAGFSFVGDLDEMIIDHYEVDFDAPTYHIEGPGKKWKKLAICLFVYLTIPGLLFFFTYVTIQNNCFAFCHS